jgi:hypothetical protein
MVRKKRKVKEYTDDEIKKAQESVKNSPSPQDGEVEKNPWCPFNEEGQNDNKGTRN